MRKPDKETFKYVIYDQDTSGVIFKENAQAYFDSVEEIISILSKFNNKENPNRYIARLANLADIKRSLKTGPGIYFIQTEFAGLIGTDINKESKMNEKIFKYVIVDNHDGSVIFLYNEKPYFDTKEEIINVLSKININKGPKAYSMGAASLESLKPFLKDDIGRFNIPIVSPDIINNPLFSPSHFQPPQKPQMINKFGLPNIIPIIPNKEIGFNNHPDWKLIKKIGTDESGTKVVVEVEIDDNRMIKIVDANEITSKDVGSFFVVVFSTQNGDLMSLNPSTAALKNMVFKTAYRLSYYDDGIFVISNPFTDVDALITEMNKDMSDLHDFHNQLNTQPFTLIR